MASGGVPASKRVLPFQRRERRIGGGFDDNGISAGDSRSGLVADEVQWKLNGLIPTTMPQGTRTVKPRSAFHAGRAFERNSFAGEAFRFFGGERDDLGCARRLHCRFCQNFPSSRVMTSASSAERFHHQVGDFAQDFIAFIAGEVLP